MMPTLTSEQKDFLVALLLQFQKGCPYYAQVDQPSMLVDIIAVITAVADVDDSNQKAFVVKLLNKFEQGCPYYGDQTAADKQMVDSIITTLTPAVTK